MQERGRESERKRETERERTQKDRNELWGQVIKEDWDYYKQGRGSLIAFDPQVAQCRNLRRKTNSNKVCLEA